MTNLTQPIVFWIGKLTSLIVCKYIYISNIYPPKVANFVTVCFLNFQKQTSIINASIVITPMTTPTFTATLKFQLVIALPQNIEEIPSDLKQLYKTVWEISQKTVLKMAADRGAYIDQSQSLNIHIAEPNYGKLTSMHFYGWKQVSWWRRLRPTGLVLFLFPRGEPADFASSRLLRVWRRGCTTWGPSRPPTPSSSPWTRRSWRRARSPSRRRRRRPRSATWPPWCVHCRTETSVSCAGPRPGPMHVSSKTPRWALSWHHWSKCTNLTLLCQILCCNCMNSFITNKIFWKWLLSGVMCRRAHGYLFFYIFPHSKVKTSNKLFRPIIKNLVQIKFLYVSFLFYTSSHYSVYSLAQKSSSVELCYICWNFYSVKSQDWWCLVFLFCDSKRDESKRTKVFGHCWKPAVSNKVMLTCQRVKDKGWKVKMQIKQCDNYF